MVVSSLTPTVTMFSAAEAPLVLSGPSYSASPKNAFSRGPLSPSDTYEYDSDSDLEDDDDIIGSLLATPSEISLKDDTEDKPVRSFSALCDEFT